MGKSIHVAVELDLPTIEDGPILVVPPELARPVRRRVGVHVRCRPKTTPSVT